MTHLPTFGFSRLTVSLVVALMAVIAMNRLNNDEVPMKNSNNNNPPTTSDAAPTTTSGKFDSLEEKMDDNDIDSVQPKATMIPNDYSNVVETTTATTLSALGKARQLQPPTVHLQRDGEYEHEDWWRQNDSLLKEAWEEWSNNQAQQDNLLPPLDSEIMMDPTLRQTVETVRQNPTPQNEDLLRELFEPILPEQVYKIPSFFNPHGIQQLRQHLDSASYLYHSAGSSDDGDNNGLVDKAGIPTRRPNGMNRYGIIVDRKIEGAVSYEAINTYLEELVSGYVRPVCRMLFPQMTSNQHPEDDEEYYAFTIRYRSDLDMALAEHSDASLYTININLNYDADDNDITTGEEVSESSSSAYSGSSLYFVDSSSSSSLSMEEVFANNSTQDQQPKVHASFNPGMAVIHRGQTRHAALPITKGERHNLVIWLFGKDAYVRVAEYNKQEQMSIQERWGKYELDL